MKISTNTGQLLFEWSSFYLTERGWKRAANGTNLWRKGRGQWLTFGEALAFQMHCDRVNFNFNKNRKANPA